jgi:hypothetical protein
VHDERPDMLELCSLVRRDHDDLLYALRVMSEPLSDEAHVIAALDRLRIVFPAHAEAETIVLSNMLEHTRPPPELYFLVSQVVAAHLAQETAVAELVQLRPGTTTFRERARYARHMFVLHADHEAACLHPVLPDLVPREVFRGLAKTYALEWKRSFEIHGSTRQMRCAG